MDPIPEAVQKRIEHERLMAKETESMARYADGRAYQQDMDAANRRRLLADALEASLRAEDEEDRRKDLAMIHMAVKDLGIDRSSYEAMMFRVSGTKSAAAMMAKERTMLIEEFKRLGWKLNKTRPNEKTFQGGSQVDFLKHLWGRLVASGKAKVAGEVGLNKFIMARFKVQRVEWLNPSQLRQAVEALKSWDARQVRSGS